MKTILLLCPYNLIDKIKQYLNIYNLNNIRYCISINNSNVINKLKSLKNKTNTPKLKDILSSGIEIDYINISDLDNEIPFYINIERYIRYKYNYNLKTSEDIKRCLKDASILGFNVQCLNLIKEIKNNREIKVIGTKSFYISSLTEGDLEAIKNNYLVNVNNEEILDPLGIISTKIISSSGDIGVEVGFTLGKIFENLKILGYSYLEFS